MASTQKKNDIVSLILEDHKALKKLIKVMKNLDKAFADRQAAFEEFAPLLTAHAKPEEQVLYVALKSDDDFRVEGVEGDVEHDIADQLSHEAQVTGDQDLWSARVKVLAELVEHHIKEEESNLLPNFKKHSEAQQRAELGEKYLRVQSEYQEESEQSDEKKSA